MQSIDDILGLENNDLRIRELTECQDYICPFIGAGVSKGCGLYTWEELIEILIGKYSNESYKKLSKMYNNIEVADRVVESAGGNSAAVMRTICDIIHKAQNKGKKSNVIDLLVSNFSNIIITTNYDTLLEDNIFSSKGKKAEVLLPTMKAQVTNAILNNSDCVIKVHGSIHESSSMIFSSGQYDEAYGRIGSIQQQKKLIPQILMQIFGGHRIMFVGCSMEEDRTMEVLREVITQNNEIYHYAIIQYPEKEQERRKTESRLAKLGIEPVYFPKEKYEYIEIILNYIVRNKKKVI